MIELDSGIAYRKKRLATPNPDTEILTQLEAGLLSSRSDFKAICAKLSLFSTIWSVVSALTRYMFSS